MGPFKVIAWLFIVWYWQEGTGRISLHCDGIQEPIQGIIYIYLYNDATKWNDPQGYFHLYKYNLSAIPGTDFTLENLPYGTYAIRVHIDQDDNGEIDYNLVGQALEQTGFSNNPVKIFSKPTFRDSRFALLKPALKLQIELR
ncbi:MAG: DUF2141 domain-containing protein [Saprospiraceae bacterium]|nr:DUF2141 domain-containing protein [Saprospiraceae bacterium]HPG06129.1 DUF2141 domain-containing protein [Saprospiraceae bacterium]HQU51926.1 DUF2141 domain-containing protein [Saprospiraceae bacterium]